MATPEEQRTFLMFLRILAVAQWVMTVIAGAALVLVWMMHEETARLAANPYRAADLTALQSYRPAFVALAVVSATALLGSIVSGVCIWRRRGRGFSLGVAVVCLLLFPVGTVIGLATLIALAQKPIRALYDARLVAKAKPVFLVIRQPPQ